MCRTERRMISPLKQSRTHVDFANALYKVQDFVRRKFTFLDFIRYFLARELYINKLLLIIMSAIYQSSSLTLGRLRLQSITCVFFFDVISSGIFVLTSRPVFGAPACRPRSVSSVCTSTYRTQLGVRNASFKALGGSTMCFSSSWV